MHKKSIHTTKELGEIRVQLLSFRKLYHIFSPSAHNRTLDFTFIALLVDVMWHFAKVGRGKHTVSFCASRSPPILKGSKEQLTNFMYDSIRVCSFLSVPNQATLVPPSTLQFPIFYSYLFQVEKNISKDHEKYRRLLKRELIFFNKFVSPGWPTMKTRLYLSGKFITHSLPMLLCGIMIGVSVDKPAKQPAIFTLKRNTKTNQ